MKSPGQDPEQVSVGKTSASKPFEDASLIYQKLSKPEVIHVFWDKSARSLMTGPNLVTANLMQPQKR